MDPNHDIVPTLRMFDGLMTGQAADEIERLRKRVDELSDLLTSARAIAERFGNNTHWERFSARLGAAGIGSITPRTFRVLPSDSPPPAPDVLISKLANLRCMATERHVPEIDIATIDLAIEHLRYFSTAPSHRLSDARMDGIYNAWRDMGDDVSYGDLMRMVEAATYEAVDAPGDADEHVCAWSMDQVAKGWWK